MIITRTPFRISFFGGGTDYPAYYEEHGGAVLSTSINKYCYITCRFLPPFFDHRFCIRYAEKEFTKDIDDIKHPSVRECLRYLNVEKGVEVVHTSDIPARSGIGSSSAFTVGLLHALHGLHGRMAHKRQLAYEAIHVEQNMIKESVGSQDQVVASFGGFNRIEFGDHARGFVVQPVTIGHEKTTVLQDNLMFYFTGFTRFASHLAKEQIEKTKDNLSQLGEMCKMVDQAIEILNGPISSMDEFGRLLHESWQLKRGLTSQISTSDIDHIYNSAIAAGAIGGKLCGAGGGGFIVFYVPRERQEHVRKALEKLLFVPIRFETIGTHVIFQQAVEWM